MIIILMDGRRVARKDYVTAKTRDLIAFGYDDLTEESVDDQLTKILAGTSLQVIGMLMVGDINVKDTNAEA